MLKVVYVFEVETLDTKRLKGGYLRKEFDTREEFDVFAKHWRKHNRWYRALSVLSLLKLETKRA